MDKAKLLMVEDDSTISQELKDELVSWGYHVDLVEDFTNIMTVFRETDPHLVYMDINLPSNNGYYWCQQIRKVSHVPIIFISSRSDQMDQIMAMQMGGDDYIEKPFNLSLLVAKTQALLRRTYDFVPENYDELKAGELTLSISESVMKWQGQEIRLTHTELLILKELFQKPGHFISRNDLIDYFALPSPPISNSSPPIRQSSPPLFLNQIRHLRQPIHASSPLNSLFCV